MSDQTDVHVDDIKLPKLQVATGIDLTTASTHNLLAKRPDETTTTFTGTLTATPTDGLIEFEPTSNDFDQEGHWEIQAHVILADGTNTRGRVAELQIGPKLV